MLGKQHKSAAAERLSTFCSHLGQDETLASWEANKMARRSGGIAYANGGGYAPSPHAFGRPGQTPNGNTPATSAYSSGK